MKTLYMFLITLLTLISSENLTAQTSPQWLHYTTANSPLPTNDLQHIIVDNLNRKWIATYCDGLIMTDDAGWNIYNTSNSSIPSNCLMSLAADGTYEFNLEQNYPNPFNPSTKIKFTIPVVGTSLMKFVQLKVYDVLGREVATLVNEFRDAGSYQVEFQSVVGNRQLASEVYYYQLRIEEFVVTKKC